MKIGLRHTFKNIFSDFIDGLLYKLGKRATYEENRSGSKTLIKEISDDGILDKATILLTPTAYSDALLHSVKTYTGDNEVDNGDFATGDFSYWSAGGPPAASEVVDYDGHTNAAHITTSSSHNGYNQISTIDGNRYLVQFDVKVISGDVYLGKSDNKVGGGNFTDASWTSYSYYWTANDTHFRFYNATASSEFYIDNISIKDVSSDFDVSSDTDATRVNSDGLIEDIDANQPRIDYTGGVGHILLEPASTNLITYSEDFSNAVWSKQEVLVEGGYLAPDGSNNAYKVTENGDDKHLVGFSSINTSNHKSIWAKTVSGTGDVYLLNRHPYNLYSLTTEWQRFDVAHNGADFFYACDFRGVGTTLTEVIIWGAQLEALSYATSYIPTHTGTTVTRDAETLSGSGNDTLINSTEGVIYVEMAALADSESYRILALSNGTADERVYMQYTNVSNTISVVVKEGGDTQANMDYVLSDETTYAKIACKWKVNDFALWVNGTERGTDSSGDIPVGLSDLSLDSHSGAYPLYGKVKCLAVFDEALSDVELAALTS
jgi:hypothetical protein